MPASRAPQLALTLVEIVVVIAIILVLAGIAVPAIGVARRSAQREQAALVVRQLVQGLDSYRLEDAQRRFPIPNGDLSLSRAAIPGPGDGNLAQLEARGVYAGAEQARDEEGRLLDPWRRPYRYSLVRPAPAAPSPALTDWNWDAAAGRVRAWGRRPDPASGAIADGALPFAYVWSLGVPGSADDARGWIYQADARP